MGQSIYKLSFFLIYLLFGLAAVSWPPTLLDGDLPKPKCDTIIIDSLCVLNPSFSPTFEPSDCSITLYNVWNNDFKCSDPVYLSVNDGDWTEVRTEQAVSFPDLKNCDKISIAVDDEGTDAIQFSGLLACDCGPCTPNDPVANAALLEVLADPMNHYLDASCCCTDYAFVFPNGKQVEAIVATMHLRVDALNNKTHTISNVDEVNKIISLD